MAEQVDESLREWKRTNIDVCLTLARKKLIIIGSKLTLSTTGRLLPALLSLYEERKWILDLPKDAEAMHSGAVDPLVSPGPDNNDGQRTALKRRRVATLSQSLIDGKPFMRDILNVSCSVRSRSFQRANPDIRCESTQDMKDA